MTLRPLDLVPAFFLIPKKWTEPQSGGVYFIVFDPAISDEPQPLKLPNHLSATLRSFNRGLRRNRD